MSAIYGIIDRLGHAIDPAWIGRMVAALAHRGPDGRSSERGPGFAMGHFLLDTAGTEPAMGCLLAEGDFVVTADCRIDNRDELVAALDVSDDSSDTLMLLRAYQAWGEDFPNHILGDFSVAIWNAREKTLICARDHFGVKPFFYFCDSRYLVFASEPGAILAAGLARPSLSDDRIADFVLGLAPPVDETSFQEVKRLPHAHIGTLGQDGWRVAAYYTMPLPAIRAWPDAPGELCRLLSQAVAARLRGGKAGAMLSGGLDSSSVACLARRQIEAADGGKLPTFSTVFDETPEFNERPFIEAVLAQGGFAPTFIPSNRLAYFAELDRIIAEQQDLFPAPNLACSRQIYQYARAENIKILLDGHGGDEVAPVGNGRMDELALRGRWIALWRVLGGTLIFKGDRKLPLFMMLLRQYSPLRHVDRAVKSVRRRLGLARARHSQFLGAINPDFAARTNVIARLRAQFMRRPDSAVTEQALQHKVLTGPMQPFAFEILDRNAAASGVEARYPFWDRRVVEFCLTLDSAEKMDLGWGRLILRRAMEGVLPPAVQWRRSKLDFGRHIAISIVRDHADLVQRTLDENRNGLGDYVDIAAGRLMLDRVREAVGQADGFDVQGIVRIMILATWLKHQHQPALETELA